MQKCITKCYVVIIVVSEELKNRKSVSQTEFISLKISEIIFIVLIKTQRCLTIFSCLVELSTVN